MALTSGMKVGPYEIVAPLGTGGMGEVYRARDARLARDVAIKVLPASFSSAPDRLRRFEQEARAVGTLSHPNILAIYDIGTHEGSPFLVTELLEGETLRERLQSGPLPLRKALDVAMQAARGIGAAHEKGIVHRDLKPANLFLTADGRVKVLDFGLAKLKQSETTSAGETQTPTKTVGAETQTGVVLGTVGYMSPEQVRGEPADARSDIFSLGTILYEMLSGQRAFRGNSSADTMAAILKDDPPELSGERRNIPLGVERIIRHCLEKNPAERFQSARDLAFDLEVLSGISTTTTAGPGPVESQPQKWLVAIAAALVLLALGAAGDHFMERSAGKIPLPTFHQLTFKRGVIYSARFAPDGQTVIYSASWDGQAPQLYSTRPDAPESRPLELTDSNLFAVSSSGQMAISLGCKYLFNADCGGTLAIVPLSGGAPRAIAEDVNSADWTPNGSKMAVVRGEAGKNRIEFPLGNALYESGGLLRSVRISPQGDAVAFLDHPTVEGPDIGSVVVLDTHGNRKVLSGSWLSLEGLAWSPRGDEVWVAGTKDHAWANEIHGLDFFGKDRVMLRLPGILRLHDVSREGRLLLSKEMWRTGILFRGPDDLKERDYSWLDLSFLSDLSPDGKNLAFIEDGEAAGTLEYGYMRKSDGSPAVRLGNCNFPVFSPDQMRVLCSNQSSDQLEILPTGVGEAKSIIPYEIALYGSYGWLPDGTEIFFEGYDRHAWRIYSQDLAGGKPRPVTPAIVPDVLVASLLSPDGKFVMDRDLNGKAWLYSMAGGNPRPVQGMERDYAWVNWSKDGRSAYIRDRNRVPAKVFRLDLSTGKKQLFTELSPGDPIGLSGIPSLRVTPDGKSYAYSYQRSSSELYLVEGVK